MPEHRTCPVCAQAVEAAVVCPIDGALLLPVRESTTQVVPEPPGKVFAERYEIQELISRNDQTFSYRATHLLLKYSVELKVLIATDSDAVKQFHEMAGAEAMRTGNGSAGTILDFGFSQDGYVYAVFTL